MCALCDECVPYVMSVCLYGLSVCQYMMSVCLFVMCDKGKPKSDECANV